MAGLAIAGGASVGHAQTAYINNTATSGATSLYTLMSGDSLTNNAAGSITITAGGTQPTVITGASGAAFVLNQGTIQSLQDPSGVAISIPTLTSLGTLTNSGAGLIQANGLGANAVFVAGGLSQLMNSATIQAAGAAGVGVNIVSNGSVGSLTNSGTGTIVANATGGNGVTIAGTLGSLLNQGSIQANGQDGIGVNVVSGGSVSSLTNTGTVQANGNGGTAINVNGAVTSIVNSGTVAANGPGGTAVNIGPSGVVQGLTNAAGGTIMATGLGGTPVNVAAGGSLNTLQNNGTIMAGSTSATAIMIAPTGNLGTINNSGSIIGGITLSTGGPGAGTQVNLNGGTVSGNIQGSSGFGNALNFNGGTVSAGSTLSNLFVINVNNGIVNEGTGGINIVGNTALNIASGATLAMNGGTIGTGFGPTILGQTPGINVSGALSVGTSVGIILGNYTQNPTGQLVVGVSPSGTTVGGVIVSGTAVINSTGPAVAMNFGTSLNGPTAPVTVLIAQGGVSGSPFPTASSNSLNPYYDFPVVTEPGGNSVVISFPTPTLPQLNSVIPCAPAVANTGGYNITFTCGAVKQLTDNLFTNGNSAAVVSIVSTLKQLSAAGLAQFYTQVQPNQVGSAGALLANAITGNGGWTTAIDDRIFGVPAGDEVGRGFTAWIKPFGQTHTQNANEGVNGFTASAYGVVAGADTMVMPNVRVGGALGLSNTNFNFNGTQSGSTASDMLFQAGVYGSYFSGNFFLDGIGAFGLHWYNTKDLISAFGLTRNANYNGVQFSTKITGGYDWKSASGVVVTPTITFEEIHLSSDSHQTSGGGLFDLNISSQQVDVMQARIGGRVAYPMPQTSGWTFTPEVHAYYVRNLILTRVATSAAFTLGGAFTVSGPQRDPDLANIGLGVTILQKGPFALTARYDYTWGQTSTDNQFFLRAKTEF